MKKLVTFLLLFIVITHSKAQIIDFYVDYSAGNFDDTTSFVRLCSIDDVSDTTDVNFAATSFITQLAGYLDDPSNIEELLYYPEFITTTIDSIFAQVVHHNYSGLTDTIVLQILSVNNNWMPTNTVLFADTIFTSQSLSSGVSDIIEINITPAYTAPLAQRLALAIQYFGPVQDTLKIAGGATKDINGTITDQSVYPTSWLTMAPGITSITRNANIGYGNPVGSEGYFPAQNWKIRARTQLIYPGSVTDNILSNTKIYPNPVENFIQVKLPEQLTEPVTLQLLNPLGQVIKSITTSTQNTVLDVVDIPNGLYFLNVLTDSGSKAFRVVVNN